MNKEWVIIWGEDSEILQDALRFIRREQIRVCGGKADWVLNSDCPAIYLQTEDGLYKKDGAPWDYPFHKIALQFPELRIKVAYEVESEAELRTLFAGSETPDDSLIENLEKELGEITEAQAESIEKTAPIDTPGEPIIQQPKEPEIEAEAADHKPGTLLWKFETGHCVASSPAIGPDGTIYVGSGALDKKLYALSGKTGVKLWEFETGGGVGSSAIGSDGTVYVGSADNKLYAINGKSGVKLWEFETGYIVTSSPAIGSDGTVYVGSFDTKLYAINGKSGDKLWEFETGNFVISSPAIGSDGTVYVGGANKLYALSGKRGVKLWEFETGDSVYSSPAIGSDGTVYVGSWDKKLYALSGKSGVKLWEFETGNYVASPAIGSDGTVYIGSWDDKLYALNGKSGVKLWEFETGGDVDSSPAIGSDGTVYVGSYDKKLYAINGKSGVKLWEFETGDGVSSSPAIGSDGTVYVGSIDYKVYAIRTGSEGLADSPWPMRGRNPQHTGRALELISPKVEEEEADTDEEAEATTETEAEENVTDAEPDGPLFDPDCENASRIEAAVRAKLKMPEGELDADSLRSIKKLKLGNCGLQDLLSIAGNLTGLKNLGLNTNAIAELTPLASLPKLEKLNLNTNKISRLNPLAELTELEHLYLNTNQITDLKPLAKLEELEVLSLNTNFISDLTPLEHLDELEELHLSTNQITDLAPLSGLSELKDLSLNRNQISDLRPLSDLTDLKLLRLSQNRITDLSPLHELRNLETVWIRNNPGLTEEEVEALKRALPDCEIAYEGFAVDEPAQPGMEEKKAELCENYPELALVFDKYNLQVDELDELDHLDLAEWDIDSIKFLSALPALRSLDLDDNHISDLTPLIDCPQLESLSLNSNRISDLTPLAGLEKLQKLEIQDNLVQDLSPLAELQSLEILYIQNNRIQDKTVLDGLPALAQVFDAENPCANTDETEAATEEAATEEAATEEAATEEVATEEVATEEVATEEAATEEAATEEVVAETSSIPSSDLEKEFLKVVAKRLGDSIELTVKLDSNFFEDLGAELIDLEDLRLDINRHWKTKISDEDIQKVQTCRDLFRFVEEALEGNGKEVCDEDQEASVDGEEDANAEDEPYERSEGEADDPAEIEAEIDEEPETEDESDEEEKEDECDPELIQSLIDSVLAVDLDGVQNAIDQGAPVDPDSDQYPVESIEDKWGGQSPCSPLEFAALYGHVELVKLLLEKGATIERSDSTIDFAIRNKHLEAAMVLKEHCEPAQWDASLFDIVEDVIKTGDLEKLQLMIELGLQLETKPDENSLLPLAQAAKAGKNEVIDFLLDHGADIHSHQDKALYSALEAGRGDIAEYLINKGAMLERRLEDLKQIQSSTDSPTVIRLLEKRGLSLEGSPAEWEEALKEYARSTCAESDESPSGEASSDDESEDRDDGNDESGEPEPDDNNPQGTLGETCPPLLPESENGSAQEPPYPPLPEASEEPAVEPLPDTETNPVKSEKENSAAEDNPTPSGVPEAPPMAVKIRPGAPMPGARSRSEPTKIKLPDHLESVNVDKGTPEIQLSPEKAQELVDEKKKADNDSQ